MYKSDRFSANAPHRDASVRVFKLDLQQHIIDPVRKALDYYTEMEKALDREKQNRAPSENVSKSKETVGAQSTSEVHTDAQGQDSKQDAQ